MALLEYNESQKISRVKSRKEALSDSSEVDQLKSASQIASSNRRQSAFVGIKSANNNSDSLTALNTTLLEFPSMSSFNFKQRRGTRVSFGISNRKTSLLNQRSAMQRMSVYEEIESDSDSGETGNFQTNGRKFIFKRNDSRFINLIETIKPVYCLQEAKDVTKIVDDNEALKSTAGVEAILLKASKKGGKRLAKSAREIIASGDYFYSRIQ
jgi:hypothetical protein